MQFIDANIFIRHLINDDPQKAQACFTLFQKAERNEVALTTSESVIAEVVYVLSSRATYHVPRAEIRALLYPLVLLPGLKLPHRRMYLRALDIYAATKLDFEDALTVAQMERQHIKQILSYDRDFDRIEDITRREP